MTLEDNALAVRTIDAVTRSPTLTNSPADHIRSGATPLLQRADEPAESDE